MTPNPGWPPTDPHPQTPPERPAEPAGSDEQRSPGVVAYPGTGGPQNRGHERSSAKLWREVWRHGRVYG